ncbi:MAG: HAD hydrolase family protein [Nitrososphaerota archaeon]|nr:HAD hydrolase family protein [Nitrososphaerota archaeon]
MRIRSLFVDYDGTIAPLGAPRSESRVFKDVEEELQKISLKVPVCVVTAKDFDFVHERCGFASGWACASGLDVRLADGRTFSAKKLRDLKDALDAASFGEGLGAQRELKHGPNGELLGVGIDWSHAQEAGAVLIGRVRSLSMAGHYVAFDGYSSFADIYAAPPNKGKAVKLLMRALGEDSCAMFIGDSENDNTAFREVDVAIGVNHGQPTGGLECGYFVEQGRLAGFLRSLSGRGLDFTPRLSEVRTRGVD